MHFGASKNSITLHTGVLFAKDFSQSFVTVCDDNCHEPNAIWAHLLPVIKHAKEIKPDIKIIHFFSDGPTSQYRQKKNFFLLNLFTQKLKLSYATWSFSEAGHGKSLADGIGGSVKRQLDQRVSYGEDVTNATDAHQILQRKMKSVKSFFISPDDVKNMKTLIPEGIRAVPGTMLLHQVISAKPDEIEHRLLSCFCGGITQPQPSTSQATQLRGLCSCHGPNKHKLLPDNMMELSPSVPVTATNTVRSQPNQKSFECLMPIENVADSENISSNLLPKSTTTCSQIERSAYDLLQVANAYQPPAKRVKTSKPDEVFPPPEVTQPGKRVETLKPYDGFRLLEVAPTTNPVLRPSQVKFEQQLPLNKAAKGRSTSRTFPCHLCKTRQPFVLQKMVQCMVCKKWACFSCSGTTFFDYICPICLE